VGRAGLQTSFVPRQGGGGGERAPGDEGRLHTSPSDVQDFFLCDFNHPPPPPPPPVLAIT